MTMHLTRLRLEQLRQFRQPLELRDLEPGLNLITGPNEAGKSTLVRAIRAAFFERHRSTAVDDLRPWGDSGAAPLVELDFQLDGQACQLSKSFLAKKRCALRMGERSYEGVEAEDHLAQIFGFQFAGKGASKSEHWGIPGLLWVEQGTGQDLHEAARHAREHLHDALQGRADRVAEAPSDGRAAAGALAATGGDALLEQLRAQRNELLTGAGKPRAAYAEAIERAQALAAQLAELNDRVLAYQKQVDLLSELRRQHQADEADRPWEALRVDLAAAQARREALQQAEKQLADDHARHQQLEQTHTLLLGQIDAHEQQQKELLRRQAAHASAVEQLQAAEATLTHARQHAQAAQAEATQARERLRLARQEDTRRSLQAQWEQAQASAARSGEALQRAQAEQQRLTALRQQAAASAITPKEVQQLRQLEARLRELGLQREAVATRLSYALLPGQALRLTDYPSTVPIEVAGNVAAAQGEHSSGEQTLTGTGQRLLSAAATLHVPGVGEITITPGGQDLSDLARDEAAAAAGLQAALQRAGLRDLAEAEGRLLAHQDQRAQIQLAEQALGLLAPKGLDALGAEALQAQASILSTREALDRLPALPTLSGTAAGSSAVLPLAQAEAAQDSSRRAEDAANAALSQAQQGQAAGLSREADARRELDASRAALGDPARLQRLVEAQQQLLACSAERDALAARLRSAREQMVAARPDIVQQDILRLSRSIEQAERAHQQRREQILLLENSLQIAGVDGLEEKRDSAAGELSRAQRRQAELQRRAAALDYLCQQLDAKRQATITRLQAPLQQHLNRYLQLLFPQAQLQMDAQLAPGALIRPDARAGTAGASEAGDFSALSFGAREQLGLISRFAYADLLREAGRPTLLILDDALVHTDEARLAQMKRVIFDAAQRHQVLLLSCHPELWRDMGVMTRILTRTPS